MRESRSGANALDVLEAPVTVLVGHFGAGKTEIAVNLALAMRGRGDDVTIVDLDLVKPYFRTRLMRDEFAARGIALVAPQGDHFYADLPILVPQVRGAIARAHSGVGRTIIDAGGHDVGARALGAVAGLSDPTKTDVLFVVNGNRPFAETCPAVLTMIAEVEVACHLKVTGLIANTHLIEETTAATVVAGLDLAREVAAATGVPIRFAVSLARLQTELPTVSTDHREVPWLTIDRHITPPLELRQPGSRRRSPVV